MLFVSGGEAFLQQQFTLANPISQVGSESTTSQVGSKSTTRLGPEFVFGVETAITNAWHGRLCYVHADLGTHTFLGNTQVATQVNAVRISVSRRIFTPD